MGRLEAKYYIIKVNFSQRIILLTQLFFIVYFQHGTCSQIWRTIPDIGPQMCSVECFRYYENCKQAQYDYHKLTCNLMNVADFSAESLPMSSTWINELPWSIKKVVEGCSNITCYSYYQCDVTTNTNLTTCSELKCPKGHYRANNDCLPCSPGYYQYHEGQYSCNKCAAGKFNPHWGKGACYNCGRGSYQPSTGQTYCHQCGQGHYQDASAQTGCKQCGPGYYQNATGQGSCEQCERGHYADANAMTSCHECPPGHKQANLGQSECNECGRGTYQNQHAQEDCIRCPVGTYQDESGKNSCKNCVTALNEGASICITD